MQRERASSSRICAECGVTRSALGAVCARGRATPAAGAFEGFRSASMTNALADLESLARHADVPILIEGETGTGKTIVARHLHAVSQRAGGPFEQVTLAALDDQLANSDLFGHVPGAFTGAVGTRKGLFASAQHGTIFLDEIGKASTIVQQKLLTAIEQHEIRPVGSDRTVSVDARVIAASNVPLATAVAANTFLPDLYARMETFRVALPPLRERRADIPLLIERLLEKHAQAAGREAPGIRDDLMRALLNADWPGNVRQLSATLQRLLISANGAAELTIEHCRGTLSWISEESALRGPLTAEQVQKALIDAHGNMSLAARRLGKSRSASYRALDRSNLE